MELAKFKSLGNQNANAAKDFPKYKIAELLRSTYGELNFRKGVADLARHCNLIQDRTITRWMKTRAGSNYSINHLVLPAVLEFFKLQNESQLYTKQHKELLKDIA